MSVNKNQTNSCKDTNQWIVFKKEVVQFPCIEQRLPKILEHSMSFLHKNVYNPYCCTYDLATLKFHQIGQ